MDEIRRKSNLSYDTQTIHPYLHFQMTSIYTKTKKTSVNTEVNEKSSIVVRLLRQPGRNAFTTSESIYDLYSKHENYKDSTSKSKEIHCIAYLKKSHLMSRII